MTGSRPTSIAAAWLCCVVLLIGTPATAFAGNDEQTVSLDDAIALVRGRTGGKVLRAETKRKNGHPVHEIRVLTDDGHVRTWRVDGTTGKVQ